MRMTENWVDVSHSIGVPFGAIGTGFGVFGKYGFVLPNFNSFPFQGKYECPEALGSYDYLSVHGNDRQNFMSLILTVDGKDYYVQKEAFETATTADIFESHEFLPFSKHIAVFKECGVQAELLLYTPIIPYELAESTIPVLCMEIAVKNISDRKVTCLLQLKLQGDYEHTQNMQAVLEKDSACAFELMPQQEKAVNGYFAWYYPEFEVPSPVLNDNFVRYYTKQFAGTEEIISYAAAHHAEWKEKILKWQDSFRCPAAMKRMWFSSLSSVITSTMMSADPCFFEIESPHSWVNTMDVTIYSAWIYMINWPEIEKMDMYQYRDHISQEGPDKGLVWHSLWSDESDYVEEPCFITRIYRDYLWYNDKEFLKDLSLTVKNAFERVYRNEYDGLIESLHGNQSYDLWKMPGVSAYVNMPWLYALYSILKMNQVPGVEIACENNDMEALLKQAIDSFEKYLWNSKEEYYNCFYRTERAEDLSVPESVFTDQMFGRWLMLIEKDTESLLPIERIRKSLEYIYKHNLIDDKENGFRGWVNGKLPGGVPCCDRTQRHVMTCWLGAQLNLASLLGELGYEEESLDVFYSIEKSLKNNHLAVGEWNQSITPDGMSSPLMDEISKDTPRFPAYPRYKSSWEYLIRMIGLKMNETQMELSPFKTFDFAIQDVELAGCRLTVKVCRDWKEIVVDGQVCEKAVFDRGGAHEVIFR